MRRPLGPMWLVEWSDGAMSGKRVVLIHRVTGRRGFGHHWSNWDQALQRALEDAGVTVLSGDDLDHRSPLG